MRAQPLAESQFVFRGLGFVHFRKAVMRKERWQRVSLFLNALSKRHHIELGMDGSYIVSNVVLTERELEGISRYNWNGTPEHADELVGDYLECVD